MSVFNVSRQTVSLDAMEAVKQGSACVGLKSKKLVVIAALKRASSDLAEPQPKVFKVPQSMFGSDSHRELIRSFVCSFDCSSAID